MKLLVFIFLIATQSFANECTSLFSDLAIARLNIEVEIQELHILNQKSYDSNPNTARIANILFNKKVKELKTYISVEEIKARLRDIPSKNKNPIIQEKYEETINSKEIYAYISDYILVQEFMHEMGLKI